MSAPTPELQQVAGSAVEGAGEHGLKQEWGILGTGHCSHKILKKSDLFL